jgi:hypothetical protein
LFGLSGLFGFSGLFGLSGFFGLSGVMDQKSFFLICHSGLDPESSFS